MSVIDTVQSGFVKTVNALLPGLSGAEKLAAVVAVAWQQLTDGRMWRSLGWLLLGVTLLWLGWLQLFREPLTKLAGAAGRVAAVAA